MTYGTRPLLADHEYAAIYRCQRCAKVNEAGIHTHRPAR